MFSEEEKERRKEEAIARRKEEFIRNGICVKNSNGEDYYMWSQTISEVILSAIAPPNTKAKDVNVEVTETSVKITLHNKTVTLIDCEWEHPIGEEIEDLDEDDYPAAGGLKFDESDKSFTPIPRPRNYGSWEITDFDEKSRVIRVTARKQNVELMRHWWQKCLKEEENHGELLKLPDRTISEYDSKKVWDEAHKMFAEKIAKQEPIEIND